MITGDESLSRTNRRQIRIRDPPQGDGPLAERSPSLIFSRIMMSKLPQVPLLLVRKRRRCHYYDRRHVCGPGRPNPFRIEKGPAPRNMVYGSAVLPGAMFMISYINGIPVLGIPACGMFSTRTIFDLIYPRVLTGERITRKEIAVLGHGGLCLDCPKCTFPICPFGKQ